MVQAQPAVNTARVVRVLRLVHAGKSAEPGSHALYSSRESPRREDAVRIKDFFEFAHLLEIAAVGTPYRQRALPRGRAPGNRGVSAERGALRKNVVRGASHAAQSLGTLFVREQSEI